MKSDELKRRINLLREQFEQAVVQAVQNRTDADYDEIGKTFGVSCVRVAQICAKHGVGRRAPKNQAAVAAK